MAFKEGKANYYVLKNLLNIHQLLKPFNEKPYVIAIHRDVRV